jgi:NADPH:quinone reductase-like Zn-dependent oxidoreductase
VPEGFTLPEVVTVPNNLVTAWHTLTTDLGVPLPWPKPDTYVPENADEAILVWGGSSSVGQYAIQLLKYYGYTNVIAAASSKHHAHLRSLGATKLIDYKDRNAVEQIAEAAEKVGGAGIKRILDCIGSLEGSMRPIARIAKEGTKVAVMLPVIVRDSTDAVDPIYAMDMDVADWDAGVEVRGVRTHYYAEVCIVKYIGPD